MKRALTFDDYVALRYLELGSATATHHVARTLGYDRVSGDRATTRARTLLRRLVRWGYVEGLRPAWGGDVRWYRITDAGREAISR